MRQFLLVVPIMFTILVSGCTSLPGGFCIPGLTCGTTVTKTDDIIVIESIQALPDNVPPDGTIKLVAIVSNVADVDAEIKNIPVTVVLYDYCQGLFKLVKGANGKIKPEIKLNLLRGEKAQVEWTLQALGKDQVSVETECTLKILARYPYATRSISTLHLIDYTEMQRRISEGTYKEVGSYQSIGYGPIKPYITVEGTQPIPVEGNKINTVLSLQVKNQGNGFLTTESGTTTATGPLITEDMLKITALSQESVAVKIKDQLDTCITEFFKDKTVKGLKLIKGETTKIMCTITPEIDAGNVPVESTKLIQASVGLKDGKTFEPDDEKTSYFYEFRKEIKVKVEPKF